MLVFISGGVRSGKSTFAEKFAQAYGKESTLHYIATSVRTDAEMNERIIRHRMDREQAAHKWHTLEQPRALEEIVGHFTTTDVILIDCLTIWLSNELFRENRWKSAEASKNLYKKMSQTIDALHQQCKHVIIVSNEIFSEGIPEDEGSQRYLYTLGKLHQYIVSKAEKAYCADYGIIRLMKEGSS